MVYQSKFTFVGSALVVRLEVPLCARAGVLLEGEGLLTDGAGLPAVAGTSHVSHRRLKVAVDRPVLGSLVRWILSTKQRQWLGVTLLLQRVMVNLP